jgi:hypothetical protein
VTARRIKDTRAAGDGQNGWLKSLLVLTGASDKAAAILVKLQESTLPCPQGRAPRQRNGNRLHDPVLYRRSALSHGGLVPFRQPGVAPIDRDGNLSICDSGNARLHRVASEGILTAIVGVCVDFSNGTPEGVRPQVPGNP